MRCRRRPVPTRRPSPGRRKLVFISIVTTPDVSATPSSPGAARRVRHDDVEQRHRHAAVGDAPRVGELVAQRHRDLGLAALEAQQLEAEHLDERDVDAGTSSGQAAMIAETPPSIGSIWPVMCLPACDANSSVAPFRSSSSPMRSSGAWPARFFGRRYARSCPWSSCSGTSPARAR